MLVDGGTDILMRGDETGLGTPEEDMLSLAAVAGLGAFSIPRSTREGSLYLDAVAYAQENMPLRPSIVHGQIASAMLGVAGDVHFTQRTHNSVLFVNPLMAMYFTATVEGLAARRLYLSELEGTQTFGQITTAIGRFRDSLPERRIPRQFPH